MTVSDDGLAELYLSGFVNEKHMQNLIEHNIDILFPGLEFLGSEFRGLDDGKHRLDTVAFDKGENTFVVIEYKNTPDKGVIDQTRAYLKHVKDKKAELTLKYQKSTGRQRDPEQFNWKAAYAVIVAPAFSANQIDSADGAIGLELYKIRLYGGGIVMMQRTGGGHERSPTPGPEGVVTPTLDPQWNEMGENANIKIGLGGDNLEKYYLDKKRASDATRSVWHELKERVISELGIRFEMHRRRGGFYLPNRRRLICWITVAQDRVKLLYYDDKKGQGILADDFIRYYKTHPRGNKHYQADVNTKGDIENAVRAIRMMHGAKKR